MTRAAAPRGYQPGWLAERRLSYVPGSLAWLRKPLALGTETFPDVHPAPRDAQPSTEEPERDPTAPLAWPGEDWWCE